MQQMPQMEWKEEAILKEAVMKEVVEVRRMPVEKEGSTEQLEKEGSTNQLVDPWFFLSQNMERVKLERAQMREKQRLEKRRIEREKILASIPTKFEPRPIAVGDLVVATSGCNYGEKGAVVEFAGLKVRIKSEDGSRVWNLQSRHNFVAYDEFKYVGKTAIQKPVFKDVEQLELLPFSTPDDFVPTPTTGAIRYADQRGWNTVSAGVACISILFVCVVGRVVFALMI